MLNRASLLPSLLLAWIVLSPTCLADETPLSVPPGIEPSLVIDLFLSDAWRGSGITPSRRCDDDAFVRRLYLDLIGRIPTMRESDEFRSDTDSDKRERLVDQLIASDEFAAHMTNVFDAYLMGRQGQHAIEQREQHGWRPYLYEAFRENRPWDRMARDMTLARASDETDVRAGWFLYERNNDYQQIAESVSANLFGLRIECAQCHDHPLASEIQQYHYWGIVALFSRGKNQQSKNGPRVFESAVGAHQSFKDLAGDDHPAELTFFDSKTIAEPQLAENGDEQKDSDKNYVEVSSQSLGEPKVPKFSRRQRFVDEILAKHPLVPRAFVNRMWALLIGRGLIHPVDRMDSMHPPSHPELLEWLSNDFRRSGYDIKRLVRQLVRSRCYQLDSRPADDNALPEHFAYAQDKPLTAESFLNSIEVVLNGEPRSTAASLLDRFRRDFPDVFAETPNSTLTQALTLSNHPEVNAMFRSDTVTIQQLLELDDTGRRVELVFRLVFNRSPEEDERAASISFLEQRDQQGQVLGQLLWAMVSSAEFRMNH